MTVEMAFEVGGRYENRKGPYEVISIDGPMMVIRWDSGEEVRTDIKGQAKVLRNMQRELEEEQSKYRRTPGWYGDAFEGLEEKDFDQDVTGTRWRAREALGGLVAKNILSEGLNFNSWAIYGSPIIHWADVRRYARRDTHYQAKLFGRMWKDDFWAGFVVERSENPADSRQDWNAFLSWLEENENTLKQTVEENDIQICDPYRTWEGSLTGTIHTSDGVWLHTRSETGEPEPLDSLHGLLAGLSNDTWVDLVLIKVFEQSYAISRGRNIGTEIGELLTKLVDVYKASTPLNAQS
jgi:hypothetical protein